MNKRFVTEDIKDELKKDPELRVKLERQIKGIFGNQLNEIKSMGDKERIVFLMGWVNSNFDNTKKRSSEDDNPAEILNDKVGECGAYSKALLGLASYFGMKGNLVNLNSIHTIIGIKKSSFDHYVTEFEFLDGKKWICDPLYGAYYKKPVSYLIDFFRKSKDGKISWEWKGTNQKRSEEDLDRLKKTYEVLTWHKNYTYEHDKDRGWYFCVQKEPVRRKLLIWEFQFRFALFRNRFLSPWIYLIYKLLKKYEK